MPDIFYVISRWWKQMLVIVVLSLLTAGTVLFLLPPKFLSVSTALPASAYLKDKASVFSNNLQQLYPAMGIPDDLDMIVGTGQLDTPYLAVARQFNLYDHYKTAEQGEAAVVKAAYILKNNTKVIKSDYGELKVKVWDTDKDLAPQLANAIMDAINSIHQDIQNSNNVTILDNLQKGNQQIQIDIRQLDKRKDSVQNSEETATKDVAARRAILSEQLQQYEKLIPQYRLMANSKSPALIPVEKARAASWPDKPKKILWLTVAFVLSAVFALLLALLLERRKPILK